MSSRQIFTDGRLDVNGEAYFREGKTAEIDTVYETRDLNGHVVYTSRKLKFKNGILVSVGA